MLTQLAKMAALADPPSLSLDVSSKRVRTAFRVGRSREDVAIVKSLPKEVSSKLRG